MPPPQAGSRGFLVEIDARIRSLRGKLPLKGDDLRLQRLVWMCDTNQSVIAELVAIIASSVVQILMQRHKLAFAIGYEPAAELDIPTVFVQMMVELLLEMVVDSTVMWAEGEHGIPVTRYFEHVRSLCVAGYHVAASIAALSWVMFSFIRLPTVATCDSDNVCECLDKPQFEAWFAGECNQTATNQTSQAQDTEDVFKNVDGFTVIIAIVTGIAMSALIWLSVMFARYRRRNHVIVVLTHELASVNALANPTTRLTARPPRSFTPDNFDAVVASEGRSEAVQLLLDLCQYWAFASPITDTKWAYFKSCVVPLSIWDEPEQFERLKAAAESCRGPLNDALRGIIRGLAGDGNDGEWLCSALPSINPRKSVAQVAGPWFPACFAVPVEAHDEKVRDAFDVNVLPDSLRFLASHEYGAFGDALVAALPPSAFREGEAKDERRRSITAMSAARSDDQQQQRLMVRYSRAKCVKQVQRMKAKVRAAQERGEAPRPRVCTIGDSLRASVCAADAAGMRSAWEHLAAGSTPWKVVRLKNKAGVPLLRKSAALACTDSLLALFRLCRLRSSWRPRGMWMLVVTTTSNRLACTPTCFSKETSAASWLRFKCICSASSR